MPATQSNVFAVTARGAAELFTNGNRSAFNKLAERYKLQALDVGGRAPVYRVSDIEAVFEKIATEQAANPALVRPQPVPNPWGRKGKPKTAVAAKKGKL